MYLKQGRSLRNLKISTETLQIPFKTIQIILKTIQILFKLQEFFWKPFKFLYKLYKCNKHPIFFIQTIQIHESLSNSIKNIQIQ